LLQGSKARTDPANPHGSSADVISQGETATANVVVGLQRLNGPGINDPSLVHHVRMARYPRQRCMFCSAIKTVPPMPLGAKTGFDHRSNASLIRM